MNSKFLPLPVMLSAGMLLATSPAAIGALETYDFTFTSSGLNATGTLTVDGGVAQFGSINVTGIPIEHPVAGDPSALTLTGISLLPGSGSAQNHNGDNLPYDNIVNFANNPILTGNGLDFASGQYSGTHYNTLVGLWGGDVNGNPVPNVYTLFVGEAGVHADGTPDNEFVYTDNTGSLTFTPVGVPEPATYGTIGGAGMLLLVFGSQIRRKLA